MAPILENDWTSNTSGGATANTLTLTKPVGAVTDDLLLIIVGNDGGNSLFWEALVGWTQFVNINAAAADTNLSCYWRIADGSENPTIDVTSSAALELFGWYMRISGVNTTTPINILGTACYTVDVSHVITEVETTVDSCLAFYAISCDGGDLAPLSISGTGWSEEDELTSGTSGQDTCGSFGTKEITTAGFTVDATVGTADSDGSSGIQFAIAPAIAGKFVALADTIGVTDTITKSKGAIISLADSIGITDAITKVGTFVRLLTENVGITDNTLTARYLIISLADTVGITDIINTTVGIVVSLADTIGITDVISKIGTFKRTLTESIGVSDGINIARDIVITIADAVEITDVIAVIKGAAHIYVQLADTVGITDTLSKIGTFKRTLTDTVSITDIITTARNIVITIVDTVGITDTITLVRGLAISLADTVGITDTIAMARGIMISLVDEISITDTVSKVGTFVRTLTDNIAITDTLSKVGTFFRSISNTVSITDNTSRGLKYFIQLVDTIGITDSIITVSGFVVRFFRGLSRDTSQSVSVQDRSWLRTVRDRLRGVRDR